ncbi:hypothetical protein NTE_02539 [Candidatus Nitrososphaera evergladensis SR1]|uniref:Uncharacterized protein n=1 Tax=Candidatus Nitrososphaera evergladensis SR1 TaxID=1459636 RepID=A0A075MSN1_9ARCH|nr:hypothetical protein NTE_02539 [Candidatus Nitrososphaera evergladensis SR1]
MVEIGGFSGSFFYFYITFTYFYTGIDLFLMDYTGVLHY